MMRVRMATVLGMLWLLCAAGWSQVAVTGRVAGQVRDSSGAAMPNATVTVTSPALMAARTVTTAADGSFLVPNLPVGTYQVTTAATGFKTDARSGVDISAGFTATVNPVLQVGASSQQVEVTGAAPVVDSRSETTSTTFDDKLLQNIPTGRDPWSTLETAPGVTTSAFDVGGNQSFYQSTMSVHGSIPGQMVYSFDGLKMSWPGGGGGATAFYIDNDALQELQSVTDAAPADVSVGGVYLNMVSKSGSNQIHGGASAYYSTAGLQASIQEPIYRGAPIPAGQPLVMLRDTEGHVGGPVLKNRWWLFGAWRLLNTKESELNLAGINKATGLFVPPPSATNHQSDLTVRNDVQVNNNNHVSATWWWNEINQFTRNNLQFTSPQAAWRQIEPAYILQTDWTTTVGSSFALDTRLGYLHLVFPLRYQPSVTPNDITLEDIAYQTLDGAATANIVEPATEWRVSQEASYYRGGLYGAHTFKFGWDDSTNRNGNYQNVNQNIRAIFNAGAPFEVQVMNGPTVERSIFHEGGAFVSDAWTIQGRLTLNLGVRYDHWNGFNPAQTNPAVDFGLGALFPQSRAIPKTPVAVWNNWSPRLGFAYDVNGKGTAVLHGAYSRYLLTQGTGLGDSVNPNNLAGLTFAWNDANGDRYPQQSEWGAQLGTLGSINTTIDPAIRRPYSQEATAGYEQELFHNVKVGVNYYYRNTRDQFGRYNLLAPPSAYTAVTGTNDLTGQPLTIYAVAPALAGQTSYFLTNAAPSNHNAYNALEITAVKRFTQRWQILAGYTLQRQLGNYTGGTGDDYNDPNQNIFRANSYLSQDSTNVVKIAGTYDFPFAGLRGSMNFQHYTGYPLRPTATYTSKDGLSPKQVETIAMNSAGAARLPSVDQVSVRFSRPTELTDRISLEPTLDIFNLTNSTSITAVNTVVVKNGGGSYLRPSNLLNPRVARLGLKLTF